MSSTAQYLSLRRFSQVYVEIQPLPSPWLRNDAIPYVPSSGTSVKENAPLWTDITRRSPTSISHKRKLSERDISTSMVEVVITKKPKHFYTPSTKTKTAANAGATKASEKFPNGYFYCHQCSKKRGPEDIICCTIMESHPNAKEKIMTERQCKVKYCIPCLKNRYGEYANEIKATGSSKKPDGHIKNQGYTFQCPKCRDICNCARCRKSKGLEPTGNLHLSACKAAAANNIKAAGVHVARQQPKAVIHKSNGISPTAGNDIQAVLLGKSQPRTKAPKPLPVPRWTKVPAYLPLADAESRFLIREFVLRFASLMDIARGHVEELDDIGGCGKWKEGDEELPTWVSEPCVKAIVLGLLRLLADGQAESTSKVIRGAMKDIRGSGANLNKIWGILSSMRDSLGSSTSGSNLSTTSSRVPSSDDLLCLSFPDPLPPPASATIHNTRNTRSGLHNNLGLYVTDSAQMVPLVEALMDATLSTAAVREDIEAGFKEGKERVKEFRDIVKKENDRWRAEKKAFEEKETDKAGEKEMKGRRRAHQETLRDLDYALKVVLNAYAPRFGPLGRDIDGRVYWALSPGVIERDRASEFITASGSANASERSNRSKTGKGRGPGRIRGPEERCEMREWSWFIGVWGKRPPAMPGTEKGAVKRRDADDNSDEDEEDDDRDVEKWWGFWEPEEIRKISGWIARTSGLAVDGKDTPSHELLPSQGLSPGEDQSVADADRGRPTRDGLKALVGRLEEYASVLEWRVRRQAGELDDGN